MAYSAETLQQIEQAIIDLASGQQVAEIRDGEQMTRFHAADLPTLRKLRDEVRGELASAAAGPASRPRAYRSHYSRGL